MSQNQRSLQDCRERPWSRSRLLHATLPAVLLVALVGPVLATSASAQAARITVDARPALRIGMADGPDAYLFQFLSEARLLPGGDFVVADRTAGELRIFNQRGEFVRTVGRRGRGPSEFQHIVALEVRGDTIFVQDPMLGKVVRFRRSGELIGTERLARLASLIGIASDGSRWWSWMAGSVRGPVTGLTADSITIGVSDAQSSEVRPVTGMVSLWRSGSSPYPFAPVTRPVLLGDSLLLPDPVAAEIAVVDARGRRARTIRVPLPATDAASAWRVLRQEMQNRDALRNRRVDDIPRVDRLPRMGAVLVDARGRIWVKRYDPLEDAHWLGGWAGGEGGEWLVLDRGGTVLAAVTLPPRLVPLYIDKDVLLGRYRDDWDVQYLAVHQVRQRL